MAERGTGTAVVIEKIREFDRVATLLDIPRVERLGILNVADHVYAALCNGTFNSHQGIKPELERRLSYALPLMRRLAGNSPVVRPAASSSNYGINAE
jgi:hypothetical protein